MQWPAAEPVRSFFALQQEKTVVLEQLAELLQRFETDGCNTLLLALLDPIGAEALQVIRQRRARPGFVRGHDPLRAFLQDVVIRNAEEVVAVRLVPIDDHLGEIIAITPETMCVQIPFEPTIRRRVRGEQSS